MVHRHVSQYAVLLVFLPSCAVTSSQCRPPAGLSVPSKASDVFTTFLESNYGHWSSGKLEIGNDGTPRITVTSTDKPFMNVIDDQDFWLFVHHRTYYLEHIEVHSSLPLKPDGSKAKAELRLIHQRSKFWSTLFGDSPLIVSIMVEQAEHAGEENDFLHWLSGGGHDASGWRSKKCHDHRGKGGIWKDTIQTSCHEYKKKGLCTNDGNYGPNWVSERPKLGGELGPLSVLIKISEGRFYGFEHYAVDGIDARKGCCACGGGGFHGIWPKSTNVTKFVTRCASKPTEWVVLNSPVLASAKQLEFLTNLRSSTQSSEHAASRRLDNFSFQRFLRESDTSSEDIFTAGVILVNDERFVVGEDMLSSLNTTAPRQIILAIMAVVVFVVVVAYAAMSLTRRTEYSALEQGKMNPLPVILLTVARWLLVTSMPIYAYASGLVSLGAGFPWEIHCAMGVFTACFSLYQLRFLNSSGLLHSDVKGAEFVAVLIHGNLAIVASYLEFAFIVLVGVIQAPEAYAHHQPPSGPRAWMFFAALICFIYARVVFGMVVGFAGYFAYGCENGMSSPRALSILTFRSNLELVGYGLVKAPASETRAQVNVEGCGVCSMIYQFGSSMTGWIICGIAVVGQTLCQILFMRTTGSQLPIIWASVACTYAQYATRASGYLPSAPPPKIRKVHEDPRDR